MSRIHLFRRRTPAAPTTPAETTEAAPPPPVAPPEDTIESAPAPEATRRRLHFPLHRPHLPGHRARAMATPPPAARVTTVLKPQERGIEALKAALSWHCGLSPDFLQQNMPELEDLLKPLNLDNAVTELVATQGSDQDLQGIAAVLEERGHEVLEEKLDSLKATLQNYVHMGEVAPVDGEKLETPSASVMELIQLLIPESMPLPEGAPVEAMGVVAKQTLTNSELKAALKLLKNPNYEPAGCLRDTVDAFIATKCITPELLEAAVKIIAPQQVATCNEVLKTNPDDIFTQRQRARMRMLTGDTEGALADYNVVTERLMDPADYFARATLNTTLGKHDAALTDLQNAASLEPVNDLYYKAFLGASAQAVTRYMDSVPEMSAVNKAELLCQRAMRLLALGDEAGAKSDAQAAQQLSTAAPTYKALLDALNSQSIVLPTVLPTVEVAEVPGTGLASTVVRGLPWVDAVVARAVATLHHDFGYMNVDPNALARDIMPYCRDVEKIITEVLATTCSPEQLRAMAGLLKGPQGAFLMEQVLPWVDTLQLRQDLWLDGLCTDIPLGVAVPARPPQPEVHALVEALLPTSAAAMAGLYGAVVDKFGADLVHGTKPEDLPTLVALLQNDTVRLLVEAYKQAMSEVNTGGVVAAAMDMAMRLAPAQITAANEILKGNPNDVEALRARATAYSFVKEHAASLADFDALVKQEPMAKSYVQRAIEFMLVGQQDRALADSDEAVRLAPLCADAYTVRASVHLAREDRLQAAEDAARAMILALTDAQQQSARAHYQMAVPLQPHEDDSVSSDEEDEVVPEAEVGAA